MVENVKNRNGRMRQYHSDACRTRQNAAAQRIGRQILAAGVTAGTVQRLISRSQRAAAVDLALLPPQERLGLLCRAAERWGVLP